MIKLNLYDILFYPYPSSTIQTNLVHHIQPNSTQSNKIMRVVPRRPVTDNISSNSFLWWGPIPPFQQITAHDQLRVCAFNWYNRLHLIFILHRWNGTIFGGFVQEFFTKLGEYLIACTRINHSYRRIVRVKLYRHYQIYLYLYL